MGEKQFLQFTYITLGSIAEHEIKCEDTSDYKYMLLHCMKNRLYMYQ